MPAGLQVFNDSGTIQVDQDYVSFSLSAKGVCSMTLDPALHPQPMYIGSVTVAGQNPIIAFRPPVQSTPGGPAVNLLSRQQSGNQFTFHFRAKHNQPFSLEYWVFDSAGYGIGGGMNFGLQIFKADGTIAFDSGTKPIRVVGVIDLVATNSASAGAVAVPTGKTYAIVQGSFALGFTQTFDGWQTEGGGEIEAPEEGGGGDPPPPSVIGQYMDCRSNHSAASRDATNIYGGMSEFESFRATAGVGEPDLNVVHGDLMFWAVDVTGY